MDKIKKTFQLFKDSWRGFSKKQKYQLIAVFALVLALPTVLGGVYTVKLLGSRAANPVTPPTTPLPFNTTISDSFDGTGSLDFTKWSLSGSLGSKAVLENNQIKLYIPSGNDSVGGNDVAVQPRINSQIPIITRDFDVSVDLAGVTTKSGWQELKFASSGSISIRRNKTGLAETLEVWTSPDNANYTRNVLRNLPTQSNPLRVKLARVGKELLAYYFEGNTFVNIMDIEFAPLQGDGVPPRLVVENNTPNYPETTGYFDNYLAYMNVKNVVTPTPSIRPTPTVKPTPTPKYCRFRLFRRCLIWAQ